MILLKILYFIFVVTLAYFFYKGKDLSKISLTRTIFLSFIFIISSLMLLIPEESRIFIKYNLVSSIFFVLITLSWFFTPKIVRKLGKFPILYFYDKSNIVRFIARLEFKSMTVKYFEVLFQQSMFLYIFFIILRNLPKNIVIIIFTLIIVLIHLANIFFMNLKWTLFYSILSLPMAIIFGNMISQGLILLTTSIHLLFYLVFNVRYWFLKKYSK